MTTVYPRPTTPSLTIRNALGEVFEVLPRLSETHDDTLHVALCRDLDLESEDRGRADLRRISQTADVRRIEITINPQQFVDVRGLDVLIDAARQTRQQDCELVVVDLRGLVQKMVAALRLENELLVLPPPAAGQDRLT